MTDETTTVASSAPMTIRIHQIDKDADPDRPGLLPPRESIDIVGNRHPDAVHGLGITRNVPVRMIDAWLDAMPEHREVFRKMTGEELDRHAGTHETYGFEPHLERAANDADNTKLAEQGTEPTGAGGPDRITATQMAATSDTPNEDTPRSQTDLGAPALGGPDAVALPPEPTPAPYAPPPATPAPTPLPAAAQQPAGAMADRAPPGGAGAVGPATPVGGF